MRNLKTNRLLSVILTLVLMLSLLPTMVYAETTELAAGTVAKETIVTPVIGQNNTFDVTLRAYGRNSATAGKDIILLLDCSGSMGTDPFTALKSTATEFVNSVLKDSTSTERIAIVTFADNATIKNNFTGYADKQALLTTIADMTSVGGTHTQGALRQAIKLLDTTTKETAVIMLSDGAPQNCFPLLAKFKDYQTPMPYRNTNTNKPNIAQDPLYLTWHQSRDMDYSYYQDSGSVSALSPFSYYYIDQVGVQRDGGSLNYTIAALAESDVLNTKTSNVYTIAYNLSDQSGIDTLKDIASDSSKAYTASTSNVSSILSEISGLVIDAGSMLKDGKIEKVSAPGFTVSNVGTVGSSYTQNGSNLTWTITKLNTSTSGVTGLKYSGNDVFYSELKFRLTATDSVLINPKNSEGKYNLMFSDPLNMSYTNLSNTNATLDFGNAYVELAITAAPVITQPKTTDTSITGTGTPGAVVTVTLPDNSTIEATVGQDGKWTAPLPAGTTLNVDDKITASAKETDKLTSPITEATVIDGRTDNQKYDPQAKTQTVELNTTPDVKNSISNIPDLPTDATYAYKNPVDTSTIGDKNATVVVTYKDGTTDEVAVIVKVIDSRTDNQKYDPQGKTQTVELNTTPDVKNSISNIPDLPTDATFAYKNPVDTSTVGDKNATVVVTYKDGTTDEVAVIVKVIDSRTDNQKYDPQGKTQTVELNTTPDVKNSISNIPDLPTDATYAYKNPVDTSTVGDKNATVVVTYKDGTTDEVAVIVKVIDSRTDNQKYDPQGKTQTVELNATPDVKNSISNIADLPTDATYAYKNPVDTSTVGDKNAVVVVTYKDGTTDEVAVIVKVIDSRTDNQKYDPQGKTQTVELNATPDVKNSISNIADLPTDATFAYKNPVDTSTIGDKNAIVVVTYKDGTTDEVAVIVKVIDSRTDNQKYDPQGKTQTVELNATPDAKNSISNTNNLPADATYAYKNPVDTSTVGDKNAIVVVTYKDGTTDEVAVIVKVIDSRTDNQKYDPQGKTQTVELNATLDVKNSISNIPDLPTDVTFAYKNPIDTSTIGDKNAIVVVTYKDGTTDEVAVIVKVIDSRGLHENHNPLGKIQTVELNATPDVKKSISNTIDLPEGTTLAYSRTVDTSTVGDKNAIVIVTYQDGTTDEVAVIVKVINSQTDNFKPVSPKTGNNRNILLSIVLLCSSIAIPVGMIAIKKRSKTIR